HCGADVTIYNRTVSRAERLAEELSCAAAGLDALDTLADEIVINCTSVGMHPNMDRCPLQAVPSSVKVVFDTIYNPVETLLLARARRAGCTCVGGLEMFVNQAVEQFQTWTGKPAPREVMRNVVLEKLTNCT
ncbi:MAG: shikimate dehydrogenase, partial [Phycisphaerae bacterium]